MNVFSFTKKKYPSVVTEKTISVDTINRFYKENEDGEFRIYVIYGTEAKKYQTGFYKIEDRNKAFNDLTEFLQNQNNQPNTTKKTMNETVNTVLTDVKAFIKQHRNSIYLIVVILLADHFLLGGQLTDKIKGILQNLLNKIEKSVGGETKPQDTTATAAPASNQTV